MKVFELFSGIGGMHFALKASGIDKEILKAIDINPTANTVYRFNFPNSNLIERNIQSLTSKDFDGCDAIMMSPPCQPFTRVGLKKDTTDERSSALLHIIKLLPDLNNLRFILLENVQGFETSQMRDKIINQLKNCSFSCQEFLLNPLQFSVPNSRLRYYLLAKKQPLEFCFERTDEVMNELPELREDVKAEVDKLNWKYKRLSGNDSCFKIGNIVDEEACDAIPDKILGRYSAVLDIVSKEDNRSCCFTKAYSHYAEGTGSVFSNETPETIAEVFDKIESVEKGSEEYLSLLKKLNLRYFSPKEVSRLMCFPDDFKFPENMSNKQKYRVLGNSINVHVVSVLTRILFS